MNTRTVKIKFITALMIVILLTLFCIAALGAADEEAIGNTPIASLAALNESTGIIPTAEKPSTGSVTPQVLTRDYLYLQEPVLTAVFGDVFAVCDKTGADAYSLITADKKGMVRARIEGLSAVDRITMPDADSAYIKSGNSLFYADLSDANTPTVSEITRYFVDGVFDIFADNGETFVQDYNNSVYSLKKDGSEFVTETIALAKPYIANSIVRYYGGKFYSYRYSDEAIYELAQNPAPNAEYAKIAVGLSDLSDYAIINGAAATLNKTRNKITLKGVTRESTAVMSMACSGNTIIICDAARQNVEICDDALAPIVKLASKSSDQGKLDAPSGISVYEDVVVVADKGNSRTAKYDINGTLKAEYKLKHAVESVIAAKDGFYVSTGTEIYRYAYNSAGGASLIGDPTSINGLLDMAIWENSLIGLKTNGEVYDFADGSTLFVLSGATKLVVNSHTNILYAMSASKIIRYNLGNRTGGEEYIGSLAGAIDFSVDYSGKIYVYFANKIECYVPDKRQMTLTLNDVFNLTGTSGEYSAAQSHNGGVYIADKGRHALLYVKASDIGAYSIYDYPTPTDFNVIRGAEYGAGALLYVVPGNAETASNALEGARFLCLAEVTADGVKYYYGNDIDSGSFYFVVAADVSLIDFHMYNVGTPKYNSILAIGANVYEYPYSDAAVQNKVGFGTLFTLLNNVAGAENDLSWGWYKVSYSLDGVVYEGYVKNLDVSPFTPLLPPAKQEYYKIKAENVGITVNVYEQPSVDSAVLFALNDGESVIVTTDQYDANSEFTRIYVNGRYGYIKTANLQKDGLTTVEITAVIVGSICGAALLGTIPLFFVLYKKHRADKIRTE